MNLRSGYPFWLIKNGLPYDYPKLEQSLRTDVLILGGGISGALTAHYLIESGISCVILDSRTIGTGSTCASTALLQYELDVPLCRLKDMLGLEKALQAYRLAAGAIEKIRILSGKVASKSFEYKKSLYCAHARKALPLLDKEYALRRSGGFKVQRLHAQDLLSDYGMHAPGAILSQAGASINPYQFTHLLHQDSIKKGLSIYDRSKATRFHYEKKGVRIETENGFTVHARKLVFANGYEAIDYLKEPGIVSLNSSYACASEQFNEPAPFWKKEALIWNTADPYTYVRTTPDRRILIGGRDEPFSDTATRDLKILQKAKKLSTDFLKIFPKIPFKAEFSWSGTFGSTADGLPIIGVNKNHPHSYFALGLGGNGIVFSQLAAEIIRDLFLKKRHEAATLFAFERKSLRSNRKR
ncbi:MAG TPA: FAD-binding oxidoreductase [Bacteroidia bacterium]|jgi:glycine/D-amino acid oxidase-like deaminating enzyme|nr:FAD-binding oxidoreductase [Bacteroidia bacterium]